jgi:hypothetical protein
MSVPKRLYDLFRSIENCDLVKRKSATKESMTEFERLLNESCPSTAEEGHHKDLVWAMYQSNQYEFINYVSMMQNRVGALILYTESKKIAKFFDVGALVHIRWDLEKKSYSVEPFVRRTERPNNYSRTNPRQRQVTKKTTYSDFRSSFRNTEPSYADAVRRPKRVQEEEVTVKSDTEPEVVASGKWADA